MVDDAHSNGSDPDAVIPPPPAAPAGGPASSVPLAPPLGGPPAPPAPQPPVSGGVDWPPAPPLPPYASAPQPGQYPYPAVPPSPGSRSGRTVGIVVASVAAFVLIIVVGIGLVVSLLLNSSPEPITAPLPSVTAAPGAPSDDEPPSDDGDDAGASAIADVLQAKIDEYKRLRDSGELWQSIPDTEFNRTAVSAFLYFLTDMKVATIWGVDAATADEYEQRMTMLEERLLAQQPLGDDIQITLEDKVFTYDGETGEGGYTAK